MSEPVSEWHEERAGALIGAHTGAPGGLLPALQTIQAEFGCIPKAAIEPLAKAFNLSRAEIYGVATFYHDFRLDEPAGRRVLKLCRGEACQAVGADALAAFAKEKLRIDWRETSADKEWTLEPVFCLGLCACGPSALLDGELLARLSIAKLDTLLDKSSP